MNLCFCFYVILLSNAPQLERAKAINRRSKDWKVERNNICSPIRTCNIDSKQIEHIPSHIHVLYDCVHLHPQKSLAVVPFLFKQNN